MPGSTSPVELLGKLAVGDGTVVTKMIVTTVSMGTSEATLAASVPGVLATDKVFAMINGGNSSGVGIEDAVPTTDTVTIHLTGTPGATTPVALLILRTE